MECGVTLVSVAEILAKNRGGLICLGQEQDIAAEDVECRSKDPDHQVCLREALAARPFFLPEHGGRIKPETLHARQPPGRQDTDHGGDDGWLCVVEVGLERVEPVQVVLPGFGGPGPVGVHHALEDVGGPWVAIRVVAPVIPGPVGGAAVGGGSPKPRMDVGGVVDGHIEHHEDPRIPCPGEKTRECRGSAEPRVYRVVVADVESLVAAGGAEKRQDPERPHAHRLQSIDLVSQGVEGLPLSRECIAVRAVHEAGGIEARSRVAGQLLPGVVEPSQQLVPDHSFARVQPLPENGQPFLSFFCAHAAPEKRH